MKYNVGQIIRARRRIVEGGYDTTGDTGAEFPSPRYIHAEPGDLGCIVHVAKDGTPTTQFCRTQTSTIVSDEEIEILID